MPATLLVRSTLGPPTPQQQQLLQFLGIKDMEDEIPDTKRKQINCEICRHNINKLGWAKQLRSRKHTENDKGAEEVDEKQCRKMWILESA